MAGDPFSQPPRPRGTFAASVIGTLAIGMIVAVAALFHFAPPEPQVVVKPPEVRVVREKAPPPEVIVREVPVPRYDPPVLPDLPRLPPVRPTPSVWEGEWRRERYPLPMFQLRQSGISVGGRCAPDWGGGVLPFDGGEVIGDAVEFAVNNAVFRTHFRMSMVGSGRARVEAWVTDEDWIESLSRANRVARSPQEAAVLKGILERNAKRLRKRQTVGIFTRQANAAGG